MRNLYLCQILIFVVALVVVHSDAFLFKKAMKKDMKMAEKGMKKGGRSRYGMPSRHVQHVSHASFHMPDYQQGGEVEIHEMDMSHAADFMNMIHRHEMHSNPPPMMPMGMMMPTMGAMPPMAMLMRQMMMLNMMQNVMNEQKEDKPEEARPSESATSMPPGMQTVMIVPMPNERLVAPNMAPPMPPPMMGMMAPHGPAHPPVPFHGPPMAHMPMPSNRIETKLPLGQVEHLESSPTEVITSDDVLPESVNSTRVNEVTRPTDTTSP